MKKSLVWLIVVLCVVIAAGALLLVLQGGRGNAQAGDNETTQPSTVQTGADGAEDLETTPEEMEMESTATTEATAATQATQATQSGAQGETTPKPTEAQKEETKPTEPAAPSESTKPTQSTEPTESTKPSGGHTLLTFEEYLALDASGRQAYVESFSSMEEAMLWYATAQKEYEESQDKIDISGGNIDLGQIQGSLGK